MKKLPIGIQTFSKIRQENYCYADKTQHIGRLVEQGSYYFLARPRRFGKSLLLDTIAEAFRGKKELFQGLYLENNWDWQTSHPVITIDFTQGILDSRSRLVPWFIATSRHWGWMYARKTPQVMAKST